MHSEQPDSGSAARILFLYSDTGGGHRAAAQAIDRALKALPGGRAIETHQIDAFASSWFPVREGVASYGTMLKVQPSLRNTLAAPLSGVEMSHNFPAVRHKPSSSGRPRRRATG